MKKREALAGFVLVLWVGVGSTLLGAQETTEAPVRGRMQSIYQALSSAFVVSLEPDEFQAAGNRQLILEALDRIAAEARQLEGHSMVSSPGFKLLSGSLAEDASSALELFEAEDYPASRYFLGRLTGYCFACHSRLPAATRLDVGQDLFENPKVQALSSRERMRLAVAARRFETAVTLGEEILQSVDQSPAAIDLSGTIDDYLKLVLRVRGDFTRAARILKEFGQRPDLPEYLSSYIEVWLQALDNIQHNLDSDDKLALARSLINHGRIQNEFPADRKGLIQFVVATSLLHQFVESPAVEIGDQAEAYYLLGVIEGSISHTWPSEGDFYLEASIRLAPDSPFAEDSYVLLEEYLISGYMGMAGAEIPQEIQDHLRDLRELIER